MTEMNSAKRIIDTFEVWGTIIYIDAAGASEKKIREGISEIQKYFHLIDEIFSPYQESSQLCRFNRGELKLDQTHPLFQECYNNLQILKELTDGYFDPFAVRLQSTGVKGFDPSGYVKGWASDHALAMMKKHGATSIQINSAGDISLAGGYEDEGWKIGIRSPDDAHTIVKIFDIADGAIATSGAYERGAHIFDPHTGMIAIGAASATVYGPDGGVCEALSTALMVAGRDGAYLFGTQAFEQYGAWVIDRHSDVAWSVAGEAQNTLSKH
jgi:thiamine biosynthesis lipoprotein